MDKKRGRGSRNSPRLSTQGGALNVHVDQNLKKKVIILKNIISSDCRFDKKKAFVHLFSTWTGGGVCVRCPHLPTGGGWGSKLVHVVVECPLTGRGVLYEALVQITTI